MPQLIPYHLTFSGGLHIGIRGVDLEESSVVIPSDTLFSAIAATWRRMGQDVDQLLTPFAGKSPTPPFLLTSAFPRVGNVRFHPMPVKPQTLFSDALLQTRGKALKRIQFLSEGLLQKLLAGKKLDEDLFAEETKAHTEKNGFALQGGTLWLSAAEYAQLPPAFQREKGKELSIRYEPVWASERTPRVTIGRITSAANIFHAGRVKFAQDCGLWFGLAWTRVDPNLETLVGQALALLQHAGLGGERTSGYGAFTFAEAARVTLPDPTRGHAALLLSRYHPRGEELPTALTHAEAAYQLVPVGGWLNFPGYAPQRRKRLLMVSEGSLVCPPDYPAGDCSDVRPEYPAGKFAHAIYRAGFALAVGWKTGG
ncbi:MAG: type III-A CRISPR-associated RAMP protein Csm4 [Anaerolineales bacterium]|nr:type III-A CRISPR-associated RAMP protein Csm4 [Anaerolineales bacterium]